MTSASGSFQTADLMVGCVKRMGRFLDDDLGSCGLSLSRAKLLFALGRLQPQRQTELAATFGLAPRTVTELLDSLERDGLVERRPDPDDRRARLVGLTPAGERARVIALGIREQITGRILSVLSEKQVADLTTALRLIEAEMSKIDAEHSSVGNVADIPTAS